MTWPVRLRADAAATPYGLIFGVLGVLGAAAIALLHLDHLPVVLCVLKLTTGYPCLTCGTTRALGRLAHFDLRGALAMNPLAATAALAFVPWGLADAALLSRGRALRLAIEPRWHDAVRVAAIVLALANWAYLVAAGR